MAAFGSRSRRRSTTTGCCSIPVPLRRLLRRASSIAIRSTRATVTIPKAGIYQVDIYPKEPVIPAPDVSRLGEGLAGSWPLDGEVAGKLQGEAKFVDSPFGKAVSLSGAADSVVIPRSDAMNVGERRFHGGGWIHPSQLRKAGIVGLGAARGRTAGIWKCPMPAGRFGSKRPDRTSSPMGLTLAAGRSSRQRVAACRGGCEARKAGDRGKSETRLFVNGYPVARGAIGLGEPGQSGGGSAIWAGRQRPGIRGRTGRGTHLSPGSRRGGNSGIVATGKQFVQPPSTQGARGRRQQDVVTLTLGDRQFSGPSSSPRSWRCVWRPARCRLPPGTPVSGTWTASCSRRFRPGTTLAKRFAAFEKRLPRLGVHLGLRRDCGSTIGPVGPPQTVASGKLDAVCVRRRDPQFPQPGRREGQRQLPGRHSRNRRSQRVHRRPRHAAAADPIGGVRRAVLRVWPPRRTRTSSSISTARTIRRLRAKDHSQLRDARVPPSRSPPRKKRADGGVPEVVGGGRQLSARA